mmetsp:Transcript_917/g.1597  ORF Transcript_917/g.1597 Transcript_917/m.1597 type:complete len:201 (+) Transcript_917:59-661(+)
MINRFIFVSCITMMNPSNKNKELYNIPGSGWKSPSWNWGYANGTGHDCAIICRKRWGSKDKRKTLLDVLWTPKEIKDCNLLQIADVDRIRDPPFEEVKLILGLTWQRGRWDGSDGGVEGGYGEVLRTMAAAERYETEDEVSNSILLVEEMKERFHSIATQSALREMQKLDCYAEDADIDGIRRKCAALVLSEMNFIEKDF